jgi:hypothetical protein
MVAKKLNTKTPTEKDVKVETTVVAETPVQDAGAKKDVVAKKESAKKAAPKKEKADAKADAKVDAKADAKVDAKVDAKADAPKKAAPKKAAVKKVADKEEEADVEGEVTAGGKRQRYFKCEYGGNSFGRYCGLKPKQAANKALTSIIRDNGGNEQCIDKTFRFEMIECTRGGNKKRSLYEGIRTKLETPLIVKIKSTAGEKTITYKFTNKLKKVKDAEAKEAAAKKVGKKGGKKVAKEGKAAKEPKVAEVKEVKEAKVAKVASVKASPAKKAGKASAKGAKKVEAVVKA